MTDQINPERMAELVEKRNAGTMTDEEFYEMTGETRESIIARNKEAEIRSQQFFHTENSKPRLVVNALDQILATERSGGMRASEDNDWAVASTLEAAVQGLMAFAQENAPGWTFDKLISTLTLQMVCTITPGSQYNGIDYEEHWCAYNETSGKLEPLEDYGAKMIVDHLGEILVEPDNYGVPHLPKPIGEHDFSYELPILPKGQPLSPQFTVNHLEEHIREFILGAWEDPQQDLLDAYADELLFEGFSDGSLMEMAEAIKFFYQEAFTSDGMLSDHIAEVLGQLAQDPETSRRYGRKHYLRAKAMNAAAMAEEAEDEYGWDVTNEAAQKAAEFLAEYEGRGGAADQRN